MMQILQISRKAPAFVTLAMLLFIILVVLEGASTAGAMLVIAAASFSASFIISLSMMRMQEHRERQRHREELDSALSTALFLNSGGMPLGKAVGMSLRSGSGKVSSVLARLERRLRLGQTLDGAFRDDPALHGSIAAGPAGEITTNGIGAVLNARELLIKSKLSDIESSVQRYSTASMFVAVILPSFAIFSFMGSSLLSSAASVSYIYPALVCVVPSMYALSSMFISGRLHG